MDTLDFNYFSVLLAMAGRRCGEAGGIDARKSGVSQRPCQMEPAVEPVGGTRGSTDIRDLSLVF